MDSAKQQTKWPLEAMATCPLCGGTHFSVEVFDVENHMSGFNTWLKCDKCDYDVPIALVDMARV